MRQQNEITLFQIYNNSMKPDLVDNFECQFNRVMKSATMSLWKAVYTPLLYDSNLCLF